MDRFINFTFRFRWYIIILIPLVTLLFAFQLKNLEFEGSYRIWFDEESKILKDYDDFRGIFGNDDAVMILFRDENKIFNKKALKVIENITNKLWETKDIARVDSLTNYQYIHTDKRVSR